MIKKSLTQNINWINLLSLGISITAMVLYFLRLKPYSIDWIAVLVGILALLTSVLIGWQIFSIFSFKAEKEAFSNLVDEKVKNVISYKEYFDREAVLLHFSVMKVYIRTNNYYEAIQSFTDLVRLSYQNNHFLHNGDNTIILYFQEHLSSINNIVFDSENNKSESLFTLTTLKKLNQLSVNDADRLDKIIQKILLSEYRK